jgi:ribonuclease G
LLQLFRRKKREDRAAPAQAAATTPEVVKKPPVQAGAEQPRPKRRRGSRGGRGRSKKPSTTTTAAKAEASAPPQQRERSERKPAERKPAAQRKRSTTRRRQPAKRPPLPPAKRELLISVDVSEQRVAVLEDDQVAEVYLERPERRSIAGNIYKGVVDNVLPGMEAAFVEIGLEKNGFLYVDEIVTPELEGRRHGRKIQDLLSRGQDVLVQAVKDPMKSKGARLTTEISLPGRFVVFVPSGEGLGVSRRLEDDERTRLRDILKGLKVEQGGVIVRTAAEGASAEDIERDLVFLQRLWKEIEKSAKATKAPALVYQEAELPLRVVRDLFTGDFEHAYVDDDKTHKRVMGYLKKTSPHMAERVTRYREKEPLFEKFGVDTEIRSTLSRRVDLPSGGYLVFDYAEAFTVIDVNTGRFVGSRSKSSGARLEDTITKNNLEAVKEVVRQLRLRDVGGIIVIDFIDMGNPKNRATVEEALKTEFERDRTKTYVVEISPLGLVEMTRQNVTEGPREILTRKCTLCGGDGVLLSEASAAVDAERHLRALAASTRHKAYKVELNARVASILIGPGATRLAEIEERTKRRFLIEAREDLPVDHFEVLAQGTLEKLAPGKPPVEEGAEVRVELGEVGLYDARAGVGKLDGLTVVVGEAAQLVGKKVKARIGRVLDGVAYATLVETKPQADAPITAESAAEKPTRKLPATKKKASEAEAELAETTADEPEPEVEAEEPQAAESKTAAKEPTAEKKPKPPEAKQDGTEDSADKPKKRTRRGSRGGRGRKRKPAGAAATGAAATGAAADAASGNGAEAPATIHVPDPDLGRAEPESAAEEPSQDGAAAAPKKRRRRGSRGGRGRKRKTPASAEASPGSSTTE